MKPWDYILVVSDGSEAIRIDYQSPHRNANIRVLLGLCEREKGILYMVVPARSVTRSILKTARRDSALVSNLPRRSFWRMGLVDDLVWSPVTVDFQMDYGWNAFYALEEAVPTKVVSDHYAGLRKHILLLAQPGDSREIGPAIEKLHSGSPGVTRRAERGDHEVRTSCRIDKCPG